MAVKLKFWDYVRRAFWSPANLLPLAGLVVGSVLVPVPGLIYLALAWEVGYLAFVPTNERFQRRIRSEANQHAGIKQEEEQEALFRRLEPGDRSKFGEIQSICYSLETQLQTADPSTKGILEESFRKLSYLLRTYLRLLVSLGSIRSYLKSSDRESIVQRIRSLEQEIAKPEGSERVREVKQKNVTILQQRMNRVEKARENEEVIEANLHTLEDTLKLIRDNAMTLDNPAGISKQINGVITGLEESERVLKDIEHFASLEEKVSDTWGEEDGPVRERSRS